MRSSTCLILAGTMILATTAAAQPAQPSVKPQAANKDTKPAAPIVLASAEPVRSTPSMSPAPNPPAKPRFAPRVTTCRCGDPQISEDSPNQ